MSKHDWAIVVAAALISAVGLALTADQAGAWELYSAQKVQGQPSGNCVDCHGDFRDSPYTRLGVDQGWGTDLMTGHMNVISDCSVCHTSPFYPVKTKQSDGNSNFFTQSCVGCHGRPEPALGPKAAGLRQHHYNAGITLCVGCHPADSNPGTFIPVGEDVLPDNYDRNLSVVSLTDPCSPAKVGENFASSWKGLDNDGDGLYDYVDTIDCPEPGGALLQTAALASLAIVVWRRRRA